MSLRSSLLSPSCDAAASCSHSCLAVASISCWKGCEGWKPADPAISGMAADCSLLWLLGVEAWQCEQPS